MTTPASYTTLNTALQTANPAGEQSSPVRYDAPVTCTGLTATISRWVGGTVSGSPSSGNYVLGDFVVSQAGSVYICTATGNPGTWVQAGASLTGPVVVTGAFSATGVVTADAGIATGSSTTPAVIASPGFSTGVASQLSDLTRDYMVYFQIGTGGGTVAIAIGPTSGVANAILTAAVGTAGSLAPVRLPAGWFLKITVATSTIADQIAIGC